MGRWTPILVTSNLPSLLSLPPPAFLVHHHHHDFCGTSRYCHGCSNGQVPVPVRDYHLNSYYNEAPKPYAFSYNAPLDDGVGQSSRAESGDAAGRVTGSYSLNNDEGHYRVVDYVADENGFRASVRTNEPGTDNQSPADVVMQSEAGPAVPYTPYARRPLLNAPVVVPEAPVEVTENALPIVPRRPVYNRPGAYIPRNYNRNVYNRPRYAYNG